VKVRKIIKFEFDGGHDIEFIPSAAKPKVWEVWIDGVFSEEMPAGEKPSLARAWYYWEVQAPELEAELTGEPVVASALAH
jgi:hypothetical protein